MSKAIGASETRGRTVVSLQRSVGGHAATNAKAPAIEVGGRVLSFGSLDLRSSRLATGLLSLSTTGEEVRIDCCNAHFDDLLVGYLACRKAGMRPVVRRSGIDGETGPEWGVLACAAGTRAWLGARRQPRWLIGDGPYVRWWPLFERRHDPLEATAFHTDAEEVDLAKSPGPVVHDGDLWLALGTLAAGVLQRIETDERCPADPD